MTKKYDTVVIGGGHNGLVCAAYLAKTGQQVLVLEARDQVGGAAVTEEFTYGKKIPGCAHFLTQLNTNVLTDLDLPAHGLEWIEEEIGTIALRDDGRYLRFDGDTVSGTELPDEDREAFAVFNRAMKDYASTLGFLVDLPPIDIFSPDFQDKIAALKLGWKLRFGLGAEKMSEFLRIVGMNIYDLLNEEFEDELLKGALGFEAVLGTHTGPRSPGSVLTYLYRFASGNGSRITIPRGGMGAVTQAMAKAASAAGADIRTGARVEGVIVDNCSVTGVTLEGGETITADRVVSNADPKSTVFDIVGARHFEADFVHRVNNIRMRGNAAKLHIALKDLPYFKGLDAPDLKHRLLIAPTIDDVERAFNHVKYGETSAKPMMEIAIPSILDNSLAAHGHVLSATVQYAPYGLKGGWTDAAKAAFLEVCIDRIVQFAPDLRDKIEHVELVTPADLEQQFGMKGGNWHHGELTLDQMLMMRPVPLASRYALPLDGMYLCGAGAHPGGGVMGAAGRNAAQAILKGETA